jgi:hypothetical protein
MATTTNYSWTTPDDTALVKDGAAAIRTLGSSIDTTTKNLNPSTTLGDIEYRSSTANTNTRLGIGTAGQLLRVNSGASAPEWATISTGGMTLINTGGTTLTGASVTIGSIPATYNYLKLIVENPLPATDNDFLTLRVNGDSNANRHKTTTAISNATISFDSTRWEIGIGEDNASAQSIMVVDIYGYANTTTWKMAQCNILANNATTSTQFNNAIRQLAYNQTGAITSLVLAFGTGNFTSGTAYLYGVK